MGVCVNIIISVDSCDNMIKLQFLVFVLFLTRLTLSWQKTLNKMRDATSSCLRMPFLKCYQIIKKERYEPCIIIPVVYFYLNFIISILCENHKIRVTVKTTKLMAAFVNWPSRIQLRDAWHQLRYLCNNQLKLYWKRKKWVICKVQFSRRAC